MTAPERIGTCDPCNRVGMRHCAHADTCGNSVEWVRADLAAAVVAERDALRAEVERLRDPVAVHANMLRGTIAKPSLAQILHLYGADAIRAALAGKETP